MSSWHTEQVPVQRNTGGNHLSSNEEVQSEEVLEARQATLPLKTLSRPSELLLQRSVDTTGRREAS